VITLNRSDSRSLKDQLVGQLRFLVASGRFRIGERLPSTRTLASRLSISFHTVRKAYAQLADEGVLEAVPGSGYRVLERHSESRGNRLEQGASVMQAALRTLVGLGLSDSEMAYLFEEQLDLISSDTESPRFVYVAEFREAAEEGAAFLEGLLGHGVEGVPLARLESASGADYAITALPLVRRVMEHLPRTDVLGVQVTLSPEAAGAAARLYDHQTLLLVVRYSDAVGPLSRMIKSASGFGGQIIALAVEEGDTRLGGLVRQSDLVLYTTGAHRALRSHLASGAAHRVVEVTVARSEVERLREELPG
jgi:GntR family transcriptional regulator